MAIFSCWRLDRARGRDILNGVDPSTVIMSLSLVHRNAFPAVWYCMCDCGESHSINFIISKHRVHLALHFLLPKQSSLKVREPVDFD